MQLFACTCCALQTTTPNWSDASTERVNPTTGVIEHDHHHVARCPNCDGVMRPIDSPPATLRKAA